MREYLRKIDDLELVMFMLVLQGATLIVKWVQGEC